MEKVLVVFIREKYLCHHMWNQPHITIHLISNKVPQTSFFAEPIFYKKSNNEKYQSYFSESSFQKTLRKLIICGEYNKTEKRSIPMYCYGSTITCTRFPKFFADGRPQILPRPYFTSKPNEKGAKLLNSS